MDNKMNNKDNNTKGTGLRFNKGKLRYELIPPTALKEVARIFTNGAAKYTEYDKDGIMTLDGANNWKNGLSWMGTAASAKRHIEQYMNNEEMDEETNTYHLANACWNLMVLLDFYTSFPQGDDRPKKFLNYPKIGLDIDCVLADFVGGWSDVYDDVLSEPNSWHYDRKMMSRFEEMRKENTLDDFYLNLPPLIYAEDLLFEPTCYITSRPVDVKITEEWLHLHEFPAQKIYSLELGQSKLECAKEAGIDIFVDDSYDNFVELNNGGVFCYLFTQPWNEKYDVGHMRIDSLSDLPMFRK